MRSFGFFFAAAIAEIGGCFAFWLWLRLGKSVYWVVPGVVSLVIFALMLSRIDALFAGRVYAAYGGVYIVTSLLWFWLIEGQRPDKWDVLGAIVCIAGAVIILLGPRQQI